MLARVLTALVLAPALIAAAAYLPTPWFGALLLAPLALGLHEWNRLTVRSSAALWMAAAALVVLCPLLAPRPAASAWLCLAGAGLWLYHALDLKRNGLKDPFGPAAGFAVGLLCLLCAWAGMVLLHGHVPGGPLLCVAFMVVVWAADSFAYFTGRSSGRRKLAPIISPGKTVEGAIGGLMGAAAVAAVLDGLLADEVAGRTAVWMTAALAAAAMSIVGDLYQSRLKRNAGVKDSGSLLPGHGGVLDRIDGVIAAAPVFAAAWYFLK